MMIHPKKKKTCSCKSDNRPVLSGNESVVKCPECNMAMLTTFAVKQGHKVEIVDRLSKKGLHSRLVE